MAEKDRRRVLLANNVNRDNAAVASAQLQSPVAWRHCGPCFTMDVIMSDSVPGRWTMTCTNTSMLDLLGRLRPAGR